MSGDRMLKSNLLTTENPARSTSHYDRLYAQEGHGDPGRRHELDNVCTDRTVITTTTVCGQKMHSNLNPNAVEFVPSFKQQRNQIMKRNLINEKVMLKEVKGSELELIKTKPDKIMAQILKDLKETSWTNISSEENIGMHGGSETVEFVKEQGAGKSNSLGCLERSSPVRDISSCETVGYFTPPNESEDVPIEPKEQKFVYCKNTEMDNNTSFTSVNVSSESSSEQILLKGYPEVNKNHEYAKTSASSEEYTSDLVGRPQDGTDAGAIGSVLKKSRIESENKNKPKEPCFKPNVSKPQYKMVSRMKVATTQAVTAATGTVRKVGLKTAELRKDDPPKHEPNLNKISKNNATAPTNTSCPTARTQRPEIRKNVNKETVATSSAGKKSLLNRSCPLNNKLKCDEKPVLLQGHNQKECLPKNPRPTVSSKLRKAETQKVS